MSALVPDADHFRARVLQDELANALASYWVRRAGDFERVGTPECDDIALACRRHAALLAQTTDIAPEVINELCTAVQSCEVAHG